MVIDSRGAELTTVGNVSVVCQVDLRITGAITSDDEVHGGLAKGGAEAIKDKSFESIGMWVMVSFDCCGLRT
jgi:hypothetical protein